jgi:hypothetical protein
MADIPKAPIVWPNGAWKMLRKIIRAWYAAEDRGSEMTQRTIANIANVQASRVSMNKAFLQAIGIVQTEGIALTETGKSLGLGLYNENELVAQQALQKLVKENPILRELWDIIRGRGTIDKADFEAQVVIITKQGKSSPGFTTGVGVLEDILLESGMIDMSGNTFRPTRIDPVEHVREQLKVSPKEEEVNLVASNKIGLNKQGLRQVPIPISASTVWFIEVAESPAEEDLNKFIEVQRLIFGITK